MSIPQELLTLIGLRSPCQKSTGAIDDADLRVTQVEGGVGSREPFFPALCPSKASAVTRNRLHGVGSFIRLAFILANSCTDSSPLDIFALRARNSAILRCPREAPKRL